MIYGLIPIFKIVSQFLIMSIQINGMLVLSKMLTDFFEYTKKVVCFIKANDFQSSKKILINLTVI